MIDLLKDYTAQRLELLKLEATEKSSLTTGILVNVLLILVFGLFFLIMLSVSVGFFVGQYFQNYALGFLCVSVSYLLLLILVMIFRKNIKNGMANFVIKTINSN